MVAAAPPDFSGRTSVSQHGGNAGLGPILLFTMLGMAAVGVPAYPLLDRHIGWITTLVVVGMIVGMFIGMLVGFALLMWSESVWRRYRDLPPRFLGTTQVDIGTAGIAVEGLGVVAWRDVLAWEGIPDCEAALMVHTRQFEKLMLSAPVHVLIPLLMHYMDRQTLEVDAEAVRRREAGIMNCRAALFNWPVFMAGIWAGYLLSGALVIASLVAKPDGGLLKNLSFIAIGLPAIAWLVWAIPFSQLDKSTGGRVCAFEFDGTHLRSTDGKWHFNLNDVVAIDRRSKGIGFDLEILSLRPAKGRGIDMLIEREDARAMLDSLKKRTLIDRVVP